jgi:hypothetical protein
MISAKELNSSENGQMRLLRVTGFLHSSSLKVKNLKEFTYQLGFMTSVLQTYARKTKIAIDTLRFRTEVRDFFEDDIQIVPENGKLFKLLC